MKKLVPFHKGEQLLRNKIKHKIWRTQRIRKLKTRIYQKYLKNWNQIYLRTRWKMKTLRSYMAIMCKILNKIMLMMIMMILLVGGMIMSNQTWIAMKQERGEDIKEILNHFIPIKERFNKRKIHNQMMKLISKENKEKTKLDN